MNKVTKAITTISKVIEQPVMKIQGKWNSKAKDGYFMLCYIIHRFYKSSAVALAQYLQTTTERTFTAYCVAINKIEQSEKFCTDTNKVCEMLQITDGYPMVSQEERERFNIRTAHTKRLFGSEHSYEDEARMIIAMQKAEKYMDNYCRMGVHPVIPGFIHFRG